MAWRIDFKPRKIQVIWIVLGFFLAIEGILLWQFQIHRELRETIVFGATIVGGAFVLYSHMKHSEENREKYAQKLIERWNSPSPEFEKWKDRLREAYAGKLELNKYIRKRSGTEEIVLPAEEKDREIRNQIVGILNYCEEVALAVRTNTADEELIQRILDTVLIMSWEKFQPWIAGERTTLGKNGDALYIELQKVVERWGG